MGTSPKWPKGNKGQLAIPPPKILSQKVWITCQVPRGLRNEVMKACDKLGLNLSQYIRLQLEKIILAGKTRKFPKDVMEIMSPQCPHCGKDII